MKIHWALFIPALLLLFYPLDSWLRGQISLRDFEHVNRQRRPDAPHTWWRAPYFWIDPVRAFIGAWLLRHSWEIEPPLPGLWRHLPLLASLIVLSLSIGAQMHTRRDDDALFAPIGYSAGVVFALLPPQIAILVVILAGACLVGFRGWSAFFISGAIGAGAMGYMILRMDYWMVVTVVLLMEPSLLSLLVRRKLRLPVMRAH